MSAFIFNFKNKFNASGSSEQLITKEEKKEINDFSNIGENVNNDGIENGEQKFVEKVKTEDKNNIGNNPIDVLNISERTRNALMKLKIYYLKDFSDYGPDIRRFIAYEGLGKKAIDELDNAFKKFDGYCNYSIANCPFYGIKNKNSPSIGENRYVFVGDNQFTIDDFEEGNKPIEVLGLSERTLNALIRNGINRVIDLTNYGDDIRILKKLSGIGINGILEIDRALKKYNGYMNYSLKYCKFVIAYRSKTDPNILSKLREETKQAMTYPSFFEINGIKYYIYGPAFVLISDVRLKNRLLENHISFYNIIFRRSFDGIVGIGRKGVNELLYLKKDILSFYGITNIDKVIFKEEDKLDFLTAFSGFYSSLSDREKSIMGLRSDRFNKGSAKVTLEKLGESNNVTRERIRQIQIKFEELYIKYIKDLGKLLENYLLEFFSINEDISHFYYEEIEYSSTFSLIFLKKSFYEIFKNNYGFYGSKNFFLFFKLYNKDELINVQKILYSIDNFYNFKRKKDQGITFDVIAKNYNGDKGYLKGIIDYYLKNRYGIEEENGFYIFPFNKRDYETIIIEELKGLEEPIHFTQLFELISKKYPGFKWRVQTVLSKLIECEDALNVGKGLYIHSSKRPYLKGLKTTEDVIMKYLTEKENHRATISEILFFVRQYREVDNSSIEAALKLNKFGNFIKINNKEFGLKDFYQ